LKRSVQQEPTLGKHTTLLTLGVCPWFLADPSDPSELSELSELSDPAEAIAERV
jgi:hypothetical protein